MSSPTVSASIQMARNCATKCASDSHTQVRVFICLIHGKPHIQSDPVFGVPSDILEDRARQIISRVRLAAAVSEGAVRRSKLV
jgi:hypothetical protein